MPQSRCILDTSTLILLGQIADQSSLADEPLITLAELSVEVMHSSEGRCRWSRKAAPVPEAPPLRSSTWRVES